MMEQLQS